MLYYLNISFVICHFYNQCALIVEKAENNLIAPSRFNISFQNKMPEFSRLYFFIRTKTIAKRNHLLSLLSTHQNIE